MTDHERIDPGAGGTGAAGAAAPPTAAAASSSGPAAPAPPASPAAGAASDPAAIPLSDPAATAQPQLNGADASLLALIDRLTGLLERTDLEEIEVESGGTALVLRRPSALHSPVVFAASAGAGMAAPGTSHAGAGDAAHPAHTTPAADRKAVVAPLTGIYYAAPSPGSAPYVKVGSEVAVGQVIGLIEAMKLFNEIKSDVAGRVARIPAENGQLIKARQPIIEVEPL